MKRVLGIVFAVLMVFMLVGCSKSDDAGSGGTSNNTGSSGKSDSVDQGGEVRLKVWGSQDDQAMLGDMINAFKAANPGKTWNIELMVVGENDARAKYLQDSSAAADVFAFAHDQLKDLVNAGALYELSGKWKDAVIADNSAGSVEAATRDGKLYAFPMTADNGYFMYYDKSVFAEEDVKSLDKMLEVAAAAGKKVYMDIGNGWYIASFFLAAGCKVGLDDGGNAMCTFNDADGLKAAESVKSIVCNSAYVSGDDEVFAGGIGGTVAAGVSGTWKADAVREKLGANYDAAKLPTVSIGGTQIQMSSFAGYKLIGVNRSTAYAQEAMDLAAWLTNYDNQMKRFELRSMGPSNIKAADSQEVQAAPELAALAAQSAFAVAQNDVPDNFWEPTKAFGQQIIAGDVTDLQTLLDEMVDKIIT
ncbi:MAG: extracellular solute-binding protein [Oscillospiraceae bacterium]|jgi:arabinogalactan oligomer/maltooligosaccharide transport system substrate-binding protein|nr:extracellular solute-binding protein [Oscillospiraceae bacterium]